METNPDPQIPTGHARARKPALPVDRDRQCEATAKSSGQRCRAHPVLGSNVCQKHGSMGGTAVSKNGRWSSAPARLQAAYEAALADPKLIDLRRGLAMMDAILIGLQERLDHDDTPAWRQELLSKWRLFTVGEASQTDVGRLIEEGAASDRALLGLFEGLERFQKRIEEARRVRIAGAQAINARDLNTALVRFLDELQRGASAEGLAADVVDRILGRMEVAVRELGLDPTDRGVGDAARRN